MIRFIIYSLIAYFVIRLARNVIDPFFKPSIPKNNTPQKEAKPSGDYIDYEEIK